MCVTHYARDGELAVIGKDKLYRGEADMRVAIER
jgi:hypothetical protein